MSTTTSRYGVDSWFRDCGSVASHLMVVGIVLAGIGRKGPTPDVLPNLLTVLDTVITLGPMNNRSRTVVATRYLVFSAFRFHLCGSGIGMHDCTAECNRVARIRRRDVER